MAIRARLIATVALPDASAVTQGFAFHSRPGMRRVLLRDGGDLSLFDLDRALAGDATPLASVPNPWPLWTHGVHTSAPDGTLVVVVCGQRSIRAIERSGRTRWEYQHGCWGDRMHQHQGSAPCPGFGSGSCRLSADGRLLWAHVLPDVDHGDPSVDSHEEWLVLDTSDGRVLGRARIEGGSAGSEHLPHPDGKHMLLGTAQGQDGSPVHLGHWDGTSLTVSEICDGFRIPTDIHSSGRVFVSTPHSDDTLVLHQFPSGAPVMERDAESLTEPADEDSPSWDYVAGFVDAHTVIAGTRSWDEDETKQHWLLDALSLRPLGPVAYPEPIHG